MLQEKNKEPGLQDNSLKIYNIELEVAARELAPSPSMPMAI